MHEHRRTVGDARSAAERDDLADLVTQHEHDRGRDRRREPSLSRGARPAARDAARGQHDVRQPARHARRPRRARRRLQAGDEEPRAVPARRCARSLATARPTVARPRDAACTSPAPTTTSPTCCSETPALAAASPRPRSRNSITALQQATPVLDVHPPLHARARRLVPRLRPGRRQLRRQRPLRAHRADLQRLPFTDQPDGRRRSTPIPPSQRLTGLQNGGDVKRCPGAAIAAPGRRLARRSATPAASSTATRAIVPPGP